ncbi:MAG: HAMP domain-containing protein [Solirubrobacteraceae bacterium]|nr:HAMP domain-containing protein [Solirubrobacteraceae bacterium]
MSLHRRLTFVSAGAVAVTVVGLALAAYLLVGGMLRDQVDDSLRGAAAITDDRIIERLPTRPPPIPREADRIRIPGPFLAARLITEDGEATRQFGGEVTFPTPAAAREIARQPEGTLRIIDAEGDDGRSLRLLMKSLGEGRAVVVARDTQEMDTLLDRLRWVLIGLGVAGVLAAGILGRVVSGTAMRPLERLRDAVDHVGRTGDLTRRVPEDGPAELRDVAVRFNRMLERLEASTNALDASARAQRRLVADASHELRTPIAVLRTNIEVLQAAPELAGGEREAMLGEVDEQLQELGGLVSDLIELARGDEPLPALDDVRLDELVAGEVAWARRHGTGVQFDVEAEPTVVDADSERLARAVRNLLDNAVKFSPPGGVVEVRVADGVISVRDHGRGIAVDDLPHVFDRFWRADGARDVPGSGLGLAIVRQTVEAHGGEVVVDGAVPGGGARFEIRLAGATAPTAVS